MTQRRKLTDEQIMVVVKQPEAMCTAAKMAREVA